MLVVLPFHEGDRHLTEKNLSWAIQLDKQTQYECLLSYDNDTSIGEVQSLAEKYFNKVHTHRYDAWPGEKRWPFPQNNAFQKTARYIPTKFKDWWMWWESDMVPLKPGWLRTIEDEYLKAGKAFMGSVVGPYNHINGAGCYPNNVAVYSQRMMLAYSNPWDVEGAPDIQQHKHDASHLFHHLWFWQNHLPTFPDQESLKIILPTAVTFHRSKDGTLVDRLRENTGIKAWVKNLLPSKAEPQQSTVPTIVQLGRYGDIINILPVCKHLSETNGTPIRFVVSKQYRDILDGVGYVDPVVFKGEWNDLRGALAEHGNNPKVLISQVYSKTPVEMPPNVADSFAFESWNKIGFGDQWDKLPLLFDRRDMQREATLVKKYGAEDMLLVNVSGKSSPYLYGKQLLQFIRDRWSKSFKIVDLSEVKAERIYDLLGLYDAAKLLITTDTATLHLAYGAKIPVVALITDLPTIWHGARPRGNVLLSMRYRESRDRFEEIHNAIFGLTGSPTLYHVYSDFLPQQEYNRRRYKFAEKTWQDQYRIGCWKTVAILDKDLARSAKTTIGDWREVPFVKDLIDKGAERVRDFDIIVFTNRDICFHPKLTARLLDRMKSTDACYSFRKDFQRLHSPLSEAQIKNGICQCGTDLFAFKKSWWMRNRDVFPDMLLGTEAWDWCLRILVDQTNRSCETAFEDLIYHEQHPSEWLNNRFKLPGQFYNRALARTFLVARGIDLSRWQCPNCKATSTHPVL